MNFFRLTDLTWMRAQVRQTLPDTCVIQAPVHTTDSAGRQTVVYSPIAGGTVACRLDPAPGIQPEVLGGRETLLNWSMLTMEWNVTIDIDYRVVLNDVTYEVREINNDHSGRVSIKSKVVQVE